MKRSKSYPTYTCNDRRSWKEKWLAEQWGRHLINLCANGVHKVLKVDDIEQLHRDIDKEPIIKNSMADISALMVATFEKFLSPVLVVCHMVNNTEGFVTSKTSKQEEPENE